MSHNTTPHGERRLTVEWLAYLQGASLGIVIGVMAMFYVSELFAMFVLAVAVGAMPIAYLWERQLKADTGVDDGS